VVAALMFWYINQSSHLLLSYLKKVSFIVTFTLVD
jgi:hypothetical protein